MNSISPAASKTIGWLRFYGAAAVVLLHAIGPGEEPV